MTTIRQHDTYLEQVIENLGNIPPDLTRYLSMIKTLDHKCELLSREVQQSTESLLAMPPVSANPSAAFQQLQAKLDFDRKMLMQFAEEKIHVSHCDASLAFPLTRTVAPQVAQQVFDLIESAAIDLEDKIEDSENDLAVSQFAELGDFPPPASTFASPAGGLFGGGRSTPRLEEWGSLAPTPLGVENSIPAPLSAAPSLVMGGGIANPPPPAPMAPQSSMKRPASAQGSAPIRVMLKKPKDAAESNASTPGDLNVPMNE